jgi:pilus assembly protein CpaE
MERKEITLGVLATSREDRELLRTLLAALEFVRLEVEVDQYCATPADRPTLRFIEARPDVIIVDLEEPQAALQALQVLHGALPESWLFVSSAINDPELIIEAMRAGAREYLIKPIPPGSLSQALRRYLVERERAQRKSKAGEIYCVTTAKGGSGATSVTLNLAAALAEVPNTRVALLDLNSPVGDAAAYLSLIPKFTASDALEAAGRLDGVLLESYMSHADGLAVLPGPKEFWPELPPGVSDYAPGVSALARLLEVVTHTYSHALVDLNPSLDKELLRLVIETARRVVVVLTPELPALWRTQRLFGFLQTVCDTDKLRLVLNRSRKTDQITEREIQKALKHPVYWQIPNDYQACIEAINSGRPLVSGNHSELSRSYRELAYRLTGTAPPAKRRRFFGLFSRNSRS